jgi:hypothetical protein
LVTHQIHAISQITSKESGRHADQWSAGRHDFSRMNGGGSLNLFDKEVISLELNSMEGVIVIINILNEGQPCSHLHPPAPFAVSKVSHLDGPPD